MAEDCNSAKTVYYNNQILTIQIIILMNNTLFYMHKVISVVIFKIRVSTTSRSIVRNKSLYCHDELRAVVDPGRWKEVGRKAKVKKDTSNWPWSRSPLTCPQVY